MATSGSKNFTVTRSDIIASALEKIGEYDIGETVTGEDTTSASRALNLMVMAWLNKGADLFLRETVTIFLQPQQQSYSLGTSSSDHATTSYVETTLSAAEASGQTIISVTSSTGMTASDYVGIKMDDDSIHWSTISTVDSATQITIADATDDTAASGNKVYTYTTKSYRPQKIVYAYRRDTSDQDIPVDLIGEIAYRGLSDKAAEGPVNQAWYHPTLTTGTLYTWPVDGGSTVDKLVIVQQVRPDDFDAAADNPEFPIEWGEALVYGLADRIAPSYGIPRNDRLLLKAEAAEKLNDALDYDVENASVIFALE